jgi:hypothetical protein
MCLICLALGNLRVASVCFEIFVSCLERLYNALPCFEKVAAASAFASVSASTLMPRLHCLTEHISITDQVKSNAA